MNPEKPSRLTVKLAQTLMGAWTKELKVDWNVVIRSIAQKLVKEISKIRPTPISPFLYHLYMNVELLTDVEEQEYNASIVYEDDEVTESSEPEDEKGLEERDIDEEESGAEGLDPALSPPALVAPATKVHKKDTQEDKRGPVPNRGERSTKENEKVSVVPEASQQTPIPEVGRNYHADLMLNLVLAVSKSREEYGFMKHVVQNLCAKLGAAGVDDLIPVYEGRPTAEKM